MASGGAARIPILHEGLATHNAHTRKPDLPQAEISFERHRTRSIWELSLERAGVAAWQRTKEIAEILRAEVIVFQCPKSFLPTRENIRNLTAFFQQIDRGGCTLAWEPRGDDWSRPLIRDLCAENKLVHCVDPFQSTPVYGASLYWRLHGKSGYRYRYTDEDLTLLQTKLQAHAQLPGPNYVLFNNISSREDATRFCANCQIAG
jgi:uncharacterized protein YecE (DUF72 family)